MLDLWLLPGPALFVSDVADEIRRGRSVLVTTPRAARFSPMLQVARVLAGDGYECYEMEGGEGGSISRRLARVLSLDEPAGDSVSALLADDGFWRSRLLLIGADLPTWAHWGDLVARFDAHARSVDPYDRPRFIFQLTCEGDRSLPPVGDGQLVSEHRWQGIKSELDVAMWTAAHVASREMKPYQRRLLVSWVSQLALWDLDLVEHLVSLPLRELSMPIEALRTYGVTRGWADRKGTSWADGTRNQFEGADRRHSSWLALHDTSNELQRRQWAAQASILLPLLDQHRRALIRDAFAYLKPAVKHAETTEEMLEMEFNQLHNTLVQIHAPRNLQKQAERLRSYRNCLSHQGVLPFDQIFNSALLDPPSDDEPILV